MAPKAGFESIGDSRAGHLLLGDMAILFLGLLACLGAMGLAPSSSMPSASAAEYSVWSCRGPDGSPVSADAWRLQIWNAAPSDFALSDDCQTGGSLRAESAATGLGIKAQAWAGFDLPRGDVITGYRVWRYLYAPAILGGIYVSAIQERTGGTTVDDGCASVLALPNYTCSFAGSTSDPLDPSNLRDRPGISLSGLDLYTGCISTSCPPTAPTTGSSFRLYRSQVRIADNSSPSLESIGGTIAGPDPVSGRASVTVTGTDSGGGLAAFSLNLDGAGVVSGAPDGSPATCATPYTVPRPCLRGGSRTFTFDTETMSPGQHFAAGTIVDAAGNSTPWGPVYFTVADPPEPPDRVPDNGTPATASPRLTADRSVVSHPAGREATISGRLTTETGIPVSSATLTVKMTTVGSADQSGRDLAPVTTTADGRFRVPVKGAGAKQVTVSYAPIKGSVPVASVSAMARARVTVRLKRRPARVKRGKKVRFSGRLVGGGTAVSGANVEIQAIVSGGWRAIANVRARRNGSFAWRYRFRFVERNAIFSFRALVRRTLGWPWPDLKSKRVKVKVNGAR